MARTRREQLLIIGVASTVGIFVLDRYVVTPFFDARKAIDAEQGMAAAKLAEVNTLFKKERQMRRSWAEMRAAGLEASPSEAERVMLHALQGWAQQSGVANVSLRPERVNQPHGYIKVNVHVTGAGGGAAMAKLLWSVESATMPVRVENLQLTPTKIGADDVQLQMTVSRLCAVPDALKKGEPRSSVAAAGPAAGEAR